MIEGDTRREVVEWGATSLRRADEAALWQIETVSYIVDEPVCLGALLHGTFIRSQEATP